MKLLLDENLSRLLVPALRATFPGTTHVLLEGLQQASDSVIWQFAAAQGFTIVTRDSDYYELALKRGYPPKVIWVRSGNASTRSVRRLLDDHRSNIEDFVADEPSACLQIY